MPMLLGAPLVAALTPEMVAATVNLAGILGITYLSSKMNPGTKPAEQSSQAKSKAKQAAAAGANGPSCDHCDDPNDEDKNKDPKKDKDGNPLGTKGTQTSSKTMYESKGLRPGDRGYVRVDVENPSPGNTPGNLHVQFDNASKYYYNYTTNSWSPSTGSPALTSGQQSLLESPQVQNAVRKGLGYLVP